MRLRLLKSRGFTLVEVLIVVMIIGVLAMVVMPLFANASEPAKENVLRDHVRLMRMQVELFVGQHRGIPPGYPGGDRSATPSAVAFEQHMTYYTSDACATSATPSAATPIPPYMHRLPVNPFNDLATVLVLGDGDAVPVADGNTYGWFFKPATRQFLPNTPGNDSNGQAFNSY